MASVPNTGADTKTVLYIGGRNGALYTRYRSAAWHVVRASFDVTLHPEIDLNTTCLGDFDAASLDAVWIADMLEHLPREKALGIMKASHALVKAGGEWGVCMPDMESLAGYIAAKRGSEPLITMPDGIKRSALTLAFGADAAPHLQGFTPDTVAQMLLECGIGNASITARALYLWVGGVVGGTTKDRRNIRIRRSAQAATPPAPPPVAKQPHPGQFYAGILPDELDIAPKQWDA